MDIMKTQSWFVANVSPLITGLMLNGDTDPKPWADPEVGTGVRTPPPPLKNHKNIGFLSNTGPDPLKNHKATKPAFNVETSSRQQNAI